MTLLTHSTLSFQYTSDITSIIVKILIYDIKTLLYRTIHIYNIINMHRILFYNTKIVNLLTLNNSNKNNNISYKIFRYTLLEKPIILLLTWLLIKLVGFLFVANSTWFHHIETSKLVIMFPKQFDDNHLMPISIQINF